MKPIYIHYVGRRAVCVNLSVGDLLKATLRVAKRGASHWGVNGKTIAVNRCPNPLIVPWPWFLAE